MGKGHERKPWGFPYHLDFLRVLSVATRGTVSVQSQETSLSIMVVSNNDRCSVTVLNAHYQIYQPVYQVNGFDKCDVTIS